jgi:serine/threonine-protein kinase
VIGTVAGNYRILEKLGEGGMGAVYRAVDEMVERPVALKGLRTEIAQNADVVERFRAEAVALARLNHPAIATLYSCFRQGDQYFMAIEFVPGETLEQKLARGGAMSWQQATGLLLRTLEGIRHAHQMGILHRDLKPANIMITPDGQVKVTDFGIARILNSVKLTREARVVGTLEYLAPERAPWAGPPMRAATCTRWAWCITRC